MPTKPDTRVFLKQELEGLPTPFVVLLVTPSEGYLVAAREAARALVQEGQSGVYVTFNRPWETLDRALKKEGIDTTRVFYIDLATQAQAGAAGAARSERYLLLPSPKSLTELGISLSEVLNSTPVEKGKFVLLDSLTTLLVYHEIPVVEQFAHFLSSRLRTWGSRRHLPIPLGDRGQEADFHHLAVLRQENRFKRRRVSTSNRRTGLKWTHSWSNFTLPSK